MLNSGNRAKRYSVKNDVQLNLFISTSSDETFILEVLNCSSLGISAQYIGYLPEYCKLNVNDLIPNAKIIWKDKEELLGRLIVRRINSSENTTKIAFSTIDNLIPVDSTLINYLDISEKTEPQHNSELSIADIFDSLNADDYSTNLIQRFQKATNYKKCLKKNNLFFKHTILSLQNDNRISLDIQRTGGKKDFVSMASRDFLGLNSHPLVQEAAVNAIQQFGCGANGTPDSVGVTSLHEHLCNYIAQLYGKESALLFNSEYLANIGIISSITTAGDLIIADMFCNNSICEGMQLAKSTSRYFCHNEHTHLDKLLLQHRENHNGALVITEGIYDTDGEFAPIPNIINTAIKHSCNTYVDESNSIGISGPTGLGCCEHHNISHKVDIIGASITNISGCNGYFITGNQEFIDWISLFSKPYLHSTSLPPATIAATIAALQILQTDNSLLIKLQENIKYFTNGLNQIGISVNNSSKSPIITLDIGREEKLIHINHTLIEGGIYAIPLMYPQVSKENSKLKFYVSEKHSHSDLDLTISILEKAILSYK